MGRRARDDAIAALAPLLGQLERRHSKDAFAAALPFLQSVRAYLDAARDQPHTNGV